MASYRLLRLASRIKFLVSTVIQREIQDPRMGMVTVLEVELTGDLREASILVSIFGPPGVQSRTIHALEDARGFIQKEVAKNLETRNTPRLKFILNEGQDKVSRIETLMVAAQEDQEVAMAKKSGKKDDKAQKGIGAKPSKSAPRPAKSEKKASAEKGAESGIGKAAGKGPGKDAEKEPAKTGGPKGRPPRGDGEKRPRRGFDDDDSGPAKDFEVEDLGDEEKDFLEEFAAGEEEPEEDDDEDEDDEEEEEEEEEEVEKDY